VLVAAVVTTVWFAAAQTEQLIQRGRDLLAKINEHQYDDILEEMAKYLGNVESSRDRVVALTSPVTSQVAKVDQVISKLNAFDKRLDSLQEYAKNSQKDADSTNLRLIKDR